MSHIVSRDSLFEMHIYDVNMKKRLYGDRMTGECKRQMDTHKTFRTTWKGMEIPIHKKW